MTTSSTLTLSQAAQAGPDAPGVSSLCGAMASQCHVIGAHHRYAVIARLNGARDDFVQPRAYVLYIIASSHATERRAEGLTGIGQPTDVCAYTRPPLPIFSALFLPLSASI